MSFIRRLNFGTGTRVFSFSVSGGTRYSAGSSIGIGGVAAAAGFVLSVFGFGVGLAAGGGSFTFSPVRNIGPMVVIFFALVVYSTSPRDFSARKFFPLTGSRYERLKYAAMPQ